MPGINVGGRYQYQGHYGTAEDHAKRQRDQRTQAPYDAGAPSANAASTAAQGVNPNLDFNVDPTGRTSLSNQTAQQKSLLDFQSRMQADQDKLKRSQTLSDRNALLTQINKPVSGPGATVTHGGVAGSEQDARAAAFSRAKDQAGRIARSSLTTIAEQMAGRGMSGGGIQALREAGAIDGAGSGLIDVTRDQALSDANRAAQISDLTYQGGITQRGQDMAQRQSYLSLLRSLY